MIIGIDIDDTLTSLQQIKIKTAQDYIHKNNLPYKLINSNGLMFSQMFDWPMEECDKFWFEQSEKMLAEVPARENASLVTKKLKQLGHKIIIISARNIKEHNKPYEMSHNWLTKNNITFDKLIVGHVDKTQICIDEKIDVFIDDIPTTLIKLQDKNIKTILMETPHNKNQNIYFGQKASNWAQIENILIYNQI